MEGKDPFLIAVLGFFICLLQAPEIQTSTCRDIRHVNFADITYDPSGEAPHPEGTNATIECRYEYNLIPPDSQFRTCINGSWTGEWPLCRHVPDRCRRNQYLVDYYGRECKRRCRNRATPCPGSDECVCDGTCGWSCIDIDEDNYCPEVNLLEGVSVTYDPPERRFNGLANFACQNGYEHYSGFVRRRCASSGAWAGQDFICIPNARCSEPPAVERASLRATNKLYFEPGDSRAYTCNRGYTITGSRYITCNNDYTWTQPSFTCSPVQCPLIDSIEHGTVSAWSFAYESHITFSCDEGYRLEGSQRRVCQADGTWSGEPTVCQEIICPDPGIPLNGVRRNEKPEYHLNDVVYFQCNSGLALSGSQSNRCTESGNWAHPLPTCNVPCEVPSHPRNGRFRSVSPGSTVVHGSSIRLSCDWGYNARRTSLLCNNGVWSDNDEGRPLCAGRPCSVPRPSSIEVTMAYDPPVSWEELQNTGIPHGTRVSYGCRRGYRIQGTRSSTCWHGRHSASSLPTCEIATCMREEIAHGEYRYSGSTWKPSASNEPVHGTARFVVCDEGYGRESFDSSRCDDGNWINTGGDQVTCHPKPCADFQRANIASVELIAGSRASNGPYSSGSQIYFRCYSGFIPARGNGSSECLASQWRPSIPVCTQASNRAIGSITSQTLEERGTLGFSWLAVDGITNGDYHMHSCSKMRKLKNPWWKAEMTHFYNVSSVKIYNRLDHRRYEILGAEVRVGSDSEHLNNPLCGSPITEQEIRDSVGERHGILRVCEEGSGLLGDTVSVNIPTNQKKQLSLCEVEVHGQGPIYVGGEAVEGALAGCRVPRVENAEYSTKHAANQIALSGEWIRVRCSEGYTLPNDDEIYKDYFCQPDSNWNSDVSHCIPKRCNVSDVEHGYLLEGSSAWHLYEHGETISYNCRPGYEKPSESSLQCQLGQVVPTQPSCQAASCSTVPDLPEGMTFHPPPYSHDQPLIVSCQDGFRLRQPSGSVPYCSYGNWTTDLTVICQRVSCPEPGRDHQATVSPSQDQYYHGNRIQYSCPSGMLVEGDEERECIDGEWTGSQPQCVWPAPTEAPRCVLPERTNNERYSVQGYHGDIFNSGLPPNIRVHISVRCDPGYSPEQPVYTRCEDGGQWAIPPPQCILQDRSCHRPGYISRVRQFVNGDPIQNAYNYPHPSLPEGTVLVSRCSEPGLYALIGDARRNCSEGRWTGQEPRCERVITTIQIRNNQPMQIKSDGTYVIYPRGFVNIDCDLSDRRGVAEIEGQHIQRSWWQSTPRPYYLEGYGFYVQRLRLSPPLEQDSGRFTCSNTVNALSHSIEIEFTAIDCDVPGVPVHGNRHDYDTGWKQGSYFFSKQIYYTCDANYQLVGPNSIECILGHWSEPIPRCERASCPELVIRHPRTKFGSGTSIGDSVLIGCRTGYELRGQDGFMECLENGEWSQPIPTCHEIEVVASPCDSVTCEDWQRCVDGECRCINPQSCPSSNGPKVCGTNGQNYTSLCFLKAFACLLLPGLDVASDPNVCVHGVPTSPPIEPIHVTNAMPDGMSSSWSLLDGEPESPSILPTIPEPDPDTTMSVDGSTSVIHQPNPASYTFCDSHRCPSSTISESCLNTIAILVAYARRWNDESGILQIEIYEVMSGDLPSSWGPGTTQQVIIDINPPADRGCFCPTFEPNMPYIIMLSQGLTSDGLAPLEDTDFVVLYSSEIYDEISQKCPQASPTPASPDTGAGSWSSSNEAYIHQSSVSSEEDPQGTTIPAVTGGSSSDSLGEN